MAAFPQSITQPPDTACAHLSCAPAPSPHHRAFAAGTLWVVYGAAIRDLFIAVPNGIGAILGLVYCALLMVFPRKSNAK